MHARALMLSAAASIGLAALATSPPSHAQGALKPVDALIVNPESRPVPVTDKALLEAAKAIADATRRLGDAAGRTPYQESVVFFQSPSTCGGGVCRVTFSTVPTGKRLVVTYASAAFILPAADGRPRATLTDWLEGTVLTLPAPQNIGSATYIVSSPVTFYVEAGKAPRLRLDGSNIEAPAGGATATVVGYLIDAP